MREVWRVPLTIFNKSNLVVWNSETLNRNVKVWRVVNVPGNAFRISRQKSIEEQSEMCQNNVDKIIRLSEKIHVYVKQCVLKIILKI
jgi:glutathione peroxidase-family protein